MKDRTLIFSQCFFRGNGRRMSTSGLRLNEHKDGDLLRGKTPIENLLGRFRFKRQIHFPGLAECLFLAASRNLSLNLAVLDFEIAQL
jgi:hypothetical protein